jgi:putative tryptophan/tyrosine transport system substrate-binding protein
MTGPSEACRQLIRCPKPRGIDMRRREVIKSLAGLAVTALPFVARAQQPERMRRVGIQLAGGGEELDYQARVAAFVKALEQLGWTDGRNLRMEVRFGGGSEADIRKSVADLLSSAPDVILTGGTTTLGQLLRATRTVPIVFMSAVDPVGSGFVESLARPGGNATGFMQFEYNLSGKWLELLKQVAPAVTRAAVLRDATTTSGIGQFAVIQSVAPSVGVDVVPINVGDAREVERAITAFARSPTGGLIVTSSARVAAHADLIVALAARYRLPTVYNRRSFAAAGGLVSYGANSIELARLAAAYVDRILKGEKPADLPVQAPTKYDLVINLKTAKALGLTVPPALQARADEMIE